MVSVTEKLNLVSRAVIEGDAPRVELLIKELLAAGMDHLEIINCGLLPGLENVGERFKRNETFLPEVLITAHAMQAGLKMIRKMTLKEISSLGTVVMGSVKNDLHDIGKNLVVMLLEGSGFKVLDLGMDVNAAQFADAVKKHKAELIGMSALLTTTMVEMKKTIDYLIEKDLRDHVKIMIGGAPVTEIYARDIGADGYAADAMSAMQLAKSLLIS